MKKIINFFKKVVYTCNNSSCLYCPINKIKKTDCSCISAMFNYFIEIDKEIGQKIYDEFVRLDFDKIPNLHFGIDKELYKKQLETLERCCKNNILEVE